MGIARFVGCVVALVALLGAGTAEALTTPTGEYRVKRTAFSRSGSKQEAVPSGRNEFWTLQKGCKPGKQCLFREFGRLRLAPPVYGLNLRHNVFTKSFKHSFDRRCFLNEDMTSTLNLRVTKTKGSRLVRFTASMTWSWKGDPPPDPGPAPQPDPGPDPEEPSELAVASAVKAGSARATYTGTYSGPVPKDRSNRAPVDAWEGVCHG